ncbi:MAG: Aldo/keto reductase, partial [Bacilli bacterium]|nr:Aldo/keto reductase [Bacilli bacterium]
TTFDTAEGYGNGHSEEIVGTSLEGVRKDCIIATKVAKSHLKPADIRTAIENSLRRLKTDYIDIYYVHWPNPDIPIAETMAEFNKLKEEKMIRAIGLSNFSVLQLKEALQYAQVDVIQPEYSLLKRDIEQDLLPFCDQNSIGVMSYSSIAKGILTGAFHLGKTVIKDDDFRRQRRLFQPDHFEKETELIHLLKEIADSKGVTLSHIAISWLLHQPGLTSAIVGTQNEKHLIENAEAADVQLSADELIRLNQVSAKVLASL